MMTRSNDHELRAALTALDPPVRDAFRRVLIRDQADRDAISHELLLRQRAPSANFAL